MQGIEKTLVKSRILNVSENFSAGGVELCDLVAAKERTESGVR